MAAGDIDKMLREMAQVRGLKLVKSRRRKPGGDFGHYGLKDAKTDKPCFGIGERGLKATAEDVASYLRGQTKAEWKRSLIAPVPAPKPAPRRAKKPVAEPEPPLRRRMRTAKERPPSPRQVKPEPPPKRAAPAPKPVRREAPQPKVELVIREAKGSDARAIAALMDDPPTTRKISATIDVLSRAGKPVFVADEGGIVGAVSYDVMTALQHPAPLGRIVFLTTAKPARRRGIGGKLLAEAQARLRKLGCATIEVVNAIELSNANSFLRAHGFARSGYRFTREGK